MFATDCGPNGRSGRPTCPAAASCVEVLAWREERGVSGGAELTERPWLLAALDDVAAHRAGLLVVAKRDRLARDC